MYYSLNFIFILFIAIQLIYALKSEWMLKLFIDTSIENQAQAFAHNFMIYQTSIVLIVCLAVLSSNNVSIFRAIIQAILITLAYLITMIGFIYLRYHVFLKTLLICSSAIFVCTSVLCYRDFYYKDSLEAQKKDNKVDIQDIEITGIQNEILT